MRRDLATVLDELRAGLEAAGTRAGVQLSGVEMTLPVDLLVVLRGGGVALLADVARSRADAPVSRLHVLGHPRGSKPHDHHAAPLVRDAGMPFDLFIQSLTEQLDKAQATMALKARVGKLPLTFAVKDVQLDLRAFVQFVDDDLFVRPAQPGEAEASTVRLSLTTITKPMIEENSVDLSAEKPKFTLREALGGEFEEDRRRLERIGVRTVEQLQQLRQSAGADVIERLAHLPVNRLQQALMRAAAPRVSRVSNGANGSTNGAQAIRIQSPLLRAGGRLPLVQAAGAAVTVVEAGDGELLLEPLAAQMGLPAQIDFGDGQIAEVALEDGARGRWTAEGVQP